MKVIIHILALFVITGWAIVCFKYKEGGFFHLTLVVAVTALIFQWLPDKPGILQRYKDKRVKKSVGILKPNSYQ